MLFILRRIGVAFEIRSRLLYIRHLSSHTFRRVRSCLYLSLLEPVQSIHFAFPCPIRKNTFVFVRFRLAYRFVQENTWVEREQKLLKVAVLGMTKVEATNAKDNSLVDMLRLHN